MHVFGGWNEMNKAHIYIFEYILYYKATYFRRGVSRFRKGIAITVADDYVWYFGIFIEKNPISLRL